MQSNDPPAPPQEAAPPPPDDDAPPRDDEAAAASGDSPPDDDAPPRQDDDLPFDFAADEVATGDSAAHIRELSAALAAGPGGAHSASKPAGAAMTLSDRPSFGRFTEAAAPAPARPAGPVPPADLKAEQAVLGSVLIEPDSIAFALSTVRAEDFYDARHRLIWAAMTYMAQHDERIDPITVHSRLRTLDVEQKSGGLAYLAELSSTTGSSLSIEHYASTVARLATVRRVLSATHKVQAEGYQASVDPDEFIALVQNEVVGALDQLIGGPQVQISDIVQEVFEDVLARRNQEGEAVGVPTGFRDLDAKLLGLHPTDLIVLAARPAMGKTSLAVNMALNVACSRTSRGPRAGKRHGVMMFSLEMGREQLVLRLLSQKARVGLHELRKGEISVDDEVGLREAAGVLHDLNFFIDDTPALSAIDLRARAKRVHMQHGLDVIVVDYLQLMRGSGGAKQSRENEISEISRSLKALAKELNVTVVALSQLNRGVEGRADKRPMMSDLRESGAIEQDADIILFIYRDWVYNSQTASEHDAELIIAKHRAGAIGRVDLHFEGRLTRFSSRDDRYNDQYAGMAPKFG